MAFDFSKVKSLVRRTVHMTFGVPAFYQDHTMSAPVEMRARWHSKIVTMGDLDNQGYAEVIQGIDRVIFNIEEARHVNVKAKGTIFFPSLGGGMGVVAGSPLGGEGVSVPTLVLDTRERNTGPDEEIWNVTVKVNK